MSNSHTDVLLVSYVFSLGSSDGVAFLGLSALALGCSTRRGPSDERALSSFVPVSHASSKAVIQYDLWAGSISTEF
jgi:hypothetical protein